MLSNAAAGTTVRARLLKAASAAALAAGTLLAAPTADAIVINNNFTPAQAIDTAGGVNGVGMFITDIGGGFIGICTGTLINPRTVIFAAHCVNEQPASAYGVGGQAAAFFFNVNALPAVQTWYFGARQTNTAQAAYTINQISYDPRSTALGPGANFLEADVALATLDTPAAGIPTWALLFSPLPVPATIDPAKGTGYHVNITGYGNNGTAATGSTGGIDYRRRAAENMIGALASLDQTESFLFGSPAGLPQNLYHIDFDDPANASPFDFNYFLDDATTREGNTASGDSGGPMILDAANNKISTRDLVIGVLSGGYTRFFNGQPANGYGTGGFYQPLYLYWDYIAANNPYHYVTALAGNGAWEDATRWQTTLDPNYVVIDAQGQAVNGVPTSPGAGPAGDEPTFGKECFQLGAVSECVNLNTGVISSPNGAEAPAGEAGSNVGRVGIADLFPELSDGSALAVELGSDIGQANLADVTPALSDGGAGLIAAVDPEPQLVYGAGPLPAPTLTNGLPGATNFVPNNVAPTAGGTKARYFDVTLAAAGTTTLSSTVTIDRLAVRNSAGLTIAAAGNLTSLMDVSQAGGVVTVNGRLTSIGDYTLTSGILSGAGTLKAPFLTNIMGAIAPGTATTSSGPGTVGTLTVDGSVIFASASGFLVDLASASSADRLTVTNGGLNLGGTFQATALGGFVPGFGQSWTVASATGGITGAFSTVTSNFTGVLRAQLNTSGANLVLSITAVPYSTATTYTSPEQREIARALDAIRAGGGSSFALFAGTDGIPVGSLPGTFETLTPLADLAATGLAESASSLITDSITGRADQLVSAGGRGGFAFAGLETLGIGPQLASADPYDAMMMGAAAVAAAQEQAAETASALAGYRLKEGFGGFLDISGLVDSSLEVTPFAGAAEVEGVNGTLGFDYTMEDGQAFFGGALSYYTGKAELAALAQKVESDSFGLHAYAGLRDEGVVLTGYLGFAAQAYDLQRTVTLITGVQTLTAQPDGKTVTAGAKIGYDLDLGQGTLTPYLALDGTFISIDGYTEQGGSAALIAPDRETDLVEGRIGAVYKGLFDMGEGSALRPKLAVAYVFDVDSDDNVSSVSFLGFPSVPMTFVGAQRDDGWAEYEVGFEYEAQNVGVSLSYAGADNGVLDYGVISGRLSVNW